MKEQKRGLIVLRWVGFIPAAFLGAWLAWLVVFYLNQLTLGIKGIDTNDFFPRLTVEILSHGAMGAAFVYIGSNIVPNNKKIVTYLLTVFILLIAGFLAFPAVINRDWWAIVGVIAISSGAGMVAYQVSEGETEFSNH